MSDKVSTAGHAFTRDVDYYEFLGKPYTRVYYDWTTRRYYSCVCQAPKTPRDLVIPADPDAAIADDGTDVDGNYRLGFMQRKTRELHARVQEQLRQRPMTPRELADALGVSFFRMQGFFRNQPVGFVVTARTRNGHVWGLAK